MGEDKKKFQIDSGLGGTIWFIGWLFTIAYSQLSFWKAVLGLLVWPYFLGETIHLQINDNTN